MRRPARRYLSAAVVTTAAAAQYAIRHRRRDLTGKVAVVTGSSRGLGLIIARELARRGSTVVLSARNPDELFRARDELRATGTEVLAIPGDIADKATAENLINQTVREYGAIDLLFNNAGVIQVGPLESMAPQDFSAAMDIMYWGTVHTTFAALKHMRARGEGRIANITSIGGKISVPHLLPYCTAKFAAVAFSDGLRTELAPHGIRVTTVIPGLMRTGSPLNAVFKGGYRQEFAWFSTLASMPILSMDARRAGRRIVAAAVAGRGQLILTLPAKVGVRVAGLMPATVNQALILAGRLLPAAPEKSVPEKSTPGKVSHGGAPDGGSPSGEAERGRASLGVPGHAALAEGHLPGLRALTTLGLRAARRNNQSGGQAVR